MRPIQPIDIPQSVATWSLEASPITTRLRNALQRQGYRRLGELHGMTPQQIRRVKGLGAGSFEALRAVLRRLEANGNGTAPVSAPEDAAAHVVEIVDEYCRQLTARSRDIVLTRLGANRDAITLAKIGAKYDVTRERIRQIVFSHLGELRRFGGPPFLALVRQMMDRCLTAVCPLRTELMQCWLDDRLAPRRYSVAFYVRVITEMMPEFPVWLNGQDYYAPSPEQAEITAQIKAVLDGKLECAPAVEVLRLLQQRPSLARLTAAEFLAALKADASVVVKFAAPDQLLVQPPLPDPLVLVKQILDGSDMPLPLTEIIRRARNEWGEEIMPVAAYRFNRILRPEDGVFLFDEDTYGLLKHIRLPESQWPRVRDDVARYLEKEGWSVTTFEIVQRTQADWARATNPYELAAILRDDSRFVDLGRCLFTLAMPARPEGVVVVQPTPTVALG